MIINKLESKLLEKKSDKDSLLTWSQTGVACSCQKSDPISGFRDPHSDPAPSLLATPPKNSSRTKVLLSVSQQTVVGKHLDIEKALNLNG